MKSPERRSGVISNTLGRKESIQLKCKRMQAGVQISDFKLGLHQSGSMEDGHLKAFHKESLALERDRNGYSR